MISKKLLERDLLRLEELHAAAMLDPDPRVPLYYSKLAVLELCGWIEESIDAVAHRAIKNRIKSSSLQKKATEIIKRTYGFDYENNILPMLTRLVGIPNFQQLEDLLNADGSYAILTSELSSIKTQRDKAAHVSLGTLAVAIDAPTVVMVRLSKLFPILRRMYSWAVHL